MANFFQKLNPFQKINAGGVVIFLLVLLLLVQVISFIISSIFKNVPLFKGGQIVIIISAFIGLIALVKTVFKDQFDTKNILGFILIMVVVIGIYIYLPTYLPQLFSFISSSAVDSAQSLASFLNLP